MKGVFLDFLYWKQLYSCMNKLFYPDYIINSYKDLSVEFLKKNNINALILDIDNTLVPYEIPKPTEELKKWFSEMNEANINIAFVSNNNSRRVNEFNAELGYFATYKSKKPFVKCLKQAIASMNTSPESTAMMGDQIFTDILAGNRLSCLTVLVPPIKDKRDLFTRFKRALEKPILKRFKGKGNI